MNTALINTLEKLVTYLLLRSKPIIWQGGKHTGCDVTFVVVVVIFCSFACMSSNFIIINMQIIIDLRRSYTVKCFVLRH